MIKNKIIYIITIVIVVVLAAWLLWYSTQKPAQPALQSVTVAAVQRTQWVDELEALGTARANESLSITSNVTETIAEIHFQDGQQVKAGDPIVSLALGEEAAELAAANARLEEEKRELKRLTPLLRTKTVAQRVYDERRTAVELAERSVQQIKARVGDRVITAPFAGVLGLRYVSIGSLVEPGDLITTLDDIETIKLDFTMPSSYLASIQVGTPVTARAPAYQGELFRGNVASIDSRIDPDTRSLIARAILPNADHHVRPGMLMYVLLQNNPRESLSVPEEALLPKGEKVFVLRVNEQHHIELLEVTTGARLNGKVEILSGVNLNDQVVIRGHAKVKAGQEVIASLSDGLDSIDAKDDAPADAPKVAQ
ncbi:MAG: efflux RND transporter periplasmic adaptor subunit [Rickettsiales bacterium]|nr:efflux RND transporter periplasmic adaptor subunit [Rickettsiales bacterium]